VRLLVLPPFAALLFLGMRSSLGPRPANISTAAFSGDHLTNELALDSTYSVGYAIWCRRNEVDSAALYGQLPRAEVIARVRRHTLLPEGGFFDPDIPLLHRQPSSRPRERPYNLVILLEESLGAEYVGTLGGLPLTPKPFKPPLEFTYRHGNLVRAPLGPEFARDALRIILLADMLYHEQRYRLPGESRSRQDAG